MSVLVSLAFSIQRGRRRMGLVYGDRQVEGLPRVQSTPAMRELAHFVHSLTACWFDSPAVAWLAGSGYAAYFVLSLAALPCSAACRPYPSAPSPARATSVAGRAAVTRGVGAEVLSSALSPLSYLRGRQRIPLVLLHPSHVGLAFRHLVRLCCLLLNPLVAVALLAR